MESKISTKQKILDAALDLFAGRGYEAVSVAQIAEAVGIKAPSLYKHYKSKQAIFDAIIAEMDARYKLQTAQMQMSGTDANADADMFAHNSEQTLIEAGKGLFLYFLHDEYVCRFRKMLTVEQYHSEQSAALYTEQYFDAPLNYQRVMLEMLSQAEVLRQEDAQIMAMHFYAPMYMLLTMCDRQPEREAEALDMLERHIRQFNRFYGRIEES